MKLIFIGPLVSFAFSLFDHCDGLPSLSKPSNNHQPRTLKKRSFEGDTYTDMNPYSSSGNQLLGDVIPFRARLFSKRDKVLPSQQQATQEYRMQRMIDLTKRKAIVYTGAKVVAYKINFKQSTNSFDIVGSHGKTVLSVSPAAGASCASHFGYASTDNAVTFAYNSSRDWTLKFGPNVYTLLPSTTDPSLRELKDAEGRVDTTVQNSVDSGDDEFPFELIRRIVRTHSSKCPLEYLIALFVAIRELEVQCN